MNNYIIKYDDIIQILSYASIILSAIGVLINICTKTSHHNDDLIENWFRPECVLFTLIMSRVSCSVFRFDISLSF